MPSEFRTLGVICTPHALIASKAQELANALSSQQIQFASLVDCRQVGSCGAVTLDLEIEIAQIRVHPIERLERVIAVFDPSDQIAPIVLALRANFPIVPHLNLQLEGEPPSLCLYDEPYHELKRQWTPQRFVERIRQWMSETAKGQLHRDDQPLEPLLLSHSGHIVLPHDLDPDNPEFLHVRACSLPPPKYFLIASREPPDDQAPNCHIFTSVHIASPQCHGLIQWTPTSLSKLSFFAEKGGLDLIGELRNRLSARWANQGKKSQFLKAYLAIVLKLPKTRQPGGTIESVETRAFICDRTVDAIGTEIGVWTMINGEPGMIIGYDDSKGGENIPVNLLNPCHQLSRNAAATYNGFDAPVETKITAIGVGALGSQVVMNCARSAFGRWTLIDPDLMFPHNLARHLLTDFYVGMPKVAAVACQANAVVAGDASFTPLAVDVLGSASGTECSEALENAEVILDMSASLGVARHIARHIKSAARRMSLFLSPTGNDLVLLSEDAARLCTLDGLEMQYYRAVVTNAALAGHLSISGGRHRYGQTCRDVTSALAHDRVSLHAAVAARALREAVGNSEATIAIWRCEANCGVRRVDTISSMAIRHAVGDWVLWTDVTLIDRLQTLRQEKLPNETGGILIGSMDLASKTVYVVDTIPSPPDSFEWPTLYIRGCRGLRSLVNKVADKTGGMLEYVGEWHSHPIGCPPLPSGDDLKAFSWLSENMASEGLPAVMIIVGDEPSIGCYIGTMGRDNSLLQIERK
nr:Mov34/MPN/PAD-1 family protein [Nitrosomonas nitrosa]